MITLEDQFHEKLPYKTYVVLGSFDGLHVGHMGLINKAVHLADGTQCKSMVFTFKNHPLTVVKPEFAPKLLMDNNTKLKLLEASQVDIVNMVPFNEEFMKIQPREFILQLLSCYNMKGIVVGFNYKFGHKNAGNIELLTAMSKELGFELYSIDPIEFEEIPVSSSRIRKLIDEGKVEEANKMLLEPFSLQSIVIKGKQLGRTLGFPTANMYLDEQFIHPSIGVYYTKVQYKEVIYKGITSVGYNPTVGGTKLSIETYILNFNEQIYGEVIRVYFEERIRDEKKFNSLQELTIQLKEDKLFAEKKFL